MHYIRDVSKLSISIKMDVAWFNYLFVCPNYPSKLQDRFARGFFLNYPHLPEKTYSSSKVWF